MNTTNESMNNLESIVYSMNLKEAETTIGLNGHLKSLERAYYHDDINTMLDAMRKLKDLGFEINELFLKRKDGQFLWNRKKYFFHDNSGLKIENDTDYTLFLDTNESEKEIKKEIAIQLYTDNVEDVNCIFDELFLHQGKCTVFYDRINGLSVKYVIYESSTGYSYDTNNYQLAFSVEAETYEIEDILSEQEDGDLNLEVYRLKDKNSTISSIESLRTDNCDFVSNELTVENDNQIIDWGLMTPEDYNKTINGNCSHVEFESVIIVLIK